MLKLGFLGPKGTFSHEALKKYAKGNSNCVECDYTTIPEIIMAVQNGEVDEAIVPMENSLEGAINATMDTMAEDVDLKIKAEVIIEVKQNLLVRYGTKIENIKTIISHPQPIGQCRKVLECRVPECRIKLVYSTARAAEEVACGEK